MNENSTSDTKSYDKKHDFTYKLETIENFEMLKKILKSLGWKKYHATAFAKLLVEAKDWKLLNPNRVEKANEFFRRGCLGEDLGIPEAWHNLYAWTDDAFRTGAIDDEDYLLMMDALDLFSVAAYHSDKK